MQVAFGRELQVDVGVFAPVVLGIAGADADQAAIGIAAVVGAAIALAVPLGILANEALTRTVGGAIGYGPELGAPPGVAAASIAIAIVATGTVAIAVVVSARFAHKSASELIRYE